MKNNLVPLRNVAGQIPTSGDVLTYVGSGGTSFDATMSWLPVSGGSSSPEACTLVVRTNNLNNGGNMDDSNLGITGFGVWGSSLTGSVNLIVLGCWEAHVDPNNNFDLAKQAYIVPASGMYRIDMYWAFYGGAPGNQIRCYILKNGQTITHNPLGKGAAGFWGNQVVYAGQFSANDEIQFATEPPPQYTMIQGSSSTTNVVYNKNISTSTGSSVTTLNNTRIIIHKMN